MSQSYEDQNQLYYHDYFQFEGRSRCMERIWSDALGDNYPKGLDQYGFVTQHDLAFIASHLQLAAGSALLDMGCGKGGPGLKLAEQLALQLTGVDVIPAAINQAREFQGSFALTYPARFEVGNFYGIPLANQSMDAVISIDSLWAADNKLLALSQIKRVMKPGAKFIFTFWDLLSQDPVAAFESTGLRFLHREDTPDWKAYQQKVYDGILAHETELVAEMGEAANMLLYEAKASPPYLDLSVRRIYVMETD